MEKTTNQVDASGGPDPEQAACNKKFGEELESLVNRFSIENKSNTPDFILAELMVNCLSAFEAASLRREAWFGVSLNIAKGSDSLLTASEAVYGFCAWLTTRDEVTKMGAGKDCAPVRDLIKQFCEENKLPDPREDWATNLVHPSGQCSQTAT